MGWLIDWYWLIEKKPSRTSRSFVCNVFVVIIYVCVSWLKVSKGLYSFREVSWFQSKNDLWPPGSNSAALEKAISMYLYSKEGGKKGMAYRDKIQARGKSKQCKTWDWHGPVLGHSRGKPASRSVCSVVATELLLSSSLGRSRSYYPMASCG